jgi:hypothetical protein
VTQCREAAILASASWLRLSATTQELQAAAVREDEDRVEMLRNEAHALLDAHLDQHVAIARGFLNLLDKD